MKEKILIEIEEIKNIWNSFLDKISYLTEVDLKFLELFQKTLNKIDKKIKNINDLKINKNNKEISNLQINEKINVLNNFDIDKEKNNV